jgi:hypothetical protein
LLNFKKSKLQISHGDPQILFMIKSQGVAKIKLREPNFEPFFCNRDSLIFETWKNNLCVCHFYAIYELPYSNDHHPALSVFRAKTDRL